MTVIERAQCCQIVTNNYKYFRKYLLLFFFNFLKANYELRVLKCMNEFYIVNDDDDGIVNVCVKQGKWKLFIEIIKKK